MRKTSKSQALQAMSIQPVTIPNHIQICASSPSNRVSGVSCVTIVFSAKINRAIVTTNIMYANRNAAWCIAAWNKICKTSRPESFRHLLAQDDVDVYQTTCRPFETEEDKQAVYTESASVIADFVLYGFQFITKISTDIQSQAQVMMKERMPKLIN